MSSCILLLILAIVSAVTGAPRLNVQQYPPYLNDSIGANVTFYCSFPFAKDIFSVRVHWWKDGEKSFLKSKKDSRYQFEIRNRASAVFRLFNVDVSDSGTYYCKVKIADKVGNGTGTRLQVTAPPTPLKIAPLEGISSTSLKLECKTAAFYPEHLEISWLRDGVEILSGIETVKNKSAEGLYEVSSFLEEVQPAPNEVVYTCLASHVSLVVPASVNYTVNRGTDNKFQLSFGCAGGILAILLLIIILTRLKLKVSNGSKKNSEEVGHAEKPVTQGPSEQLAADATRNLRDGKGPPKTGQEIEHTVYSQTKQELPDATVEARTKSNPKHQQKEQSTVYAQTKQRGGDNKLTYAALQLAGSKKRSKSKDKSAVYAEVTVIKKERS
ncbi:natural cytotoxicity triggering receptor 3 ligand 1-like isoform X2 [Heterodontus francisci]|uniref:natural cytotoxicity triggering receptor 3 ligand 1-like isoform X2 n=1 Tax=Heterodontus francisci TaxID=7792 RepID=UPI00355B7373